MESTASISSRRRRHVSSTATIASSSINPPDLQPQKKSRRSGREAQKVPNRNVGGRGAPAGKVGEGGGSDDDDVHIARSDDDAGISGREADAETDWARRMARQGKRWDARRGPMKEEFIQHSRQISGIKQQRVESSVQQLQQTVDDAWVFHACCRDKHSALGCGLVEVSRRELQYVNLSCQATFSIPAWSCSCCSQRFEPSAIQCGCFESTPSDASSWIDTVVMEAYRCLGLEDALSGTGVCLGHCMAYMACPHMYKAYGRPVFYHATWSHGLHG